MIEELESAFDESLSAERLGRRPDGARLAAGRRWADAVWDAAQRAGALEVAPEDVRRGIAVARRPVFICGVHRSGTTLLRDLLDGHPALAVLPSEGSFLTELKAKLKRQDPADHCGVLAREWVRRLANPINQPPYWLLGRTTSEATPYVVFARAFSGWWTEVEKALGRENELWKMVPVALAYAYCRARTSIPSELCRWVDKTPNNEAFLEVLLSAFPEAKVVHVVRDPLAVFASHKRLEEQVFGSFRSSRTVLRAMARSYQVAVQRKAGDGASYCVIRYEDLVQRTEQVMDRIAAFLAIAPHPILWRPTVAEKSSAPNSSFRSDGAPGRVDHRGEVPERVLTRHEREAVAACTGSISAVLGYEAGVVGPLRSRALRIAHGIW